MILSLFDHFESPALFFIPLMALAIWMPCALILTPLNRWLSNRALALQERFFSTVAQQFMIPLNMKGHKWAALLASLMVFILAMNVLGLLPYVFTPTTQLSLTMGLAVPFWLATVILGLLNQPDYSLAHLLPEGTPTPLIPVLIIIETISLFIRPFALGVRLMANLTAGHLLMQLISLAIIALTSIMPFVAIITSGLLILLTLLEVAVALIQAYVFVLLLSLYLQENV